MLAGQEGALILLDCAIHPVLEINTLLSCRALRAKHVKNRFTGPLPGILGPLGKVGAFVVVHLRQLSPTTRRCAGIAR
jgi:hypothetical protein